VILVFCYVLLKFMYVQYWNIIPPFGRLHGKKDIEAIEKVQRRFNYEETLWTPRLFIFGTSLEVTLSKLKIVFGLSVLKCHEFF